MENITEGIMDFKSLERTIYTIMCQIACQMVGLYLATWDRIIMARRATEEYRFTDHRTTHIKTVFGEVTYSRAYYKKKSGGYVFLLDEAMGIKAGCGQVSENLAEAIAAECADKSFRKAAESISSLTGQKISRMGAWNVLQQIGQKLEEQVERLEALAQREVTGLLGNFSTPALFEEFDDVWVSMQRAVRQKKGEAIEKERRRIGKKPIHIGTGYTGWKPLENGRYETLNKVAYASFGDVPGFVSRFEALLQQFFDMDGVMCLVVNGDGEGWIKSVAESSDAILQLDPFHRSQAILRAVKDKADRKAINAALKEKDTEKVFAIICGLIARSGEAPTLKKLEDLLTYFDNNRDSLLPWQERAERVPEPPEGVVYRNMGLQEHNNCDLLTQRMKHRKGSWSMAGANNMANILCLGNTVGLDLLSRALPEIPAGEPKEVEVLSAAKSPKHDGKGYDGSWLHANLPIVETFLTHGRKAIRTLLNQRPLSDLKGI